MNNERRKTLGHAAADLDTLRTALADDDLKQRIDDVIEVLDEVGTIYPKGRGLVDEDHAKALEHVKNMVEGARDDEEEAFDNLPEGIQEGERGDTMQEAIDSLNDALEQLEELTGDMPAAA